MFGQMRSRRPRTIIIFDSPEEEAAYRAKKRKTAAKGIKICLVVIAVDLFFLLWLWKH